MNLDTEGVDVLKAPDKARKTSSDDPIMRMLKINLPNGKVKYDGSQDMAPKVLAEITRIGTSLAEVSPAYNAAWNGRIKCTTGKSLNAQEHEAMKETARKLYGALSQDGEPPLTMMQTMVGMMEPMNFKVTKEAAKFAAEASIQHLCAVANLIKTCCLEGAAYDLVTDLGPERFTEWKAALINQAAGQVPNLFRQLEEEVRKGIVEPDPDRGALAHRQLTPGYDILKLVYTYMVQLRVVLKDLRRAELAAAIEADRVKAAARGATVAPAQYGQPATRDGDRRASGADTHRAESQGNLAERPPDPEPDDSEGTEAMVEVDEQENKTQHCKQAWNGQPAKKRRPSRPTRTTYPTPKSERKHRPRLTWRTREQGPKSWLRPAKPTRLRRDSTTKTTPRR